MALNPSIPPQSRWAASPAAGRLPGDPYYKLGLQAELNRRERMAASDAVEAWRAVEKANDQLDRIDKPLSLLDTFTSIARQVMGTKVTTAAPAPIASTVWTTHGVAASAPVDWPPPAVEAEPSKPVPSAQRVDSIVVSHQDESEAWLQLVAPAALGEFQLAAERLREAADVVGDQQAGLLAQGLESLRRGLRKLADALYAPRNGGTEDRFGQMRRTDDGGYISRIGLGLQEAKMPDGRHRLEKAELENFVHRFAALNGRLGDSVHGDCNFTEGQSLYVDAWRVVATCRLYLPG